MIEESSNELATANLSQENPIEKLIGETGLLAIGGADSTPPILGPDTIDPEKFVGAETVTDDLSNLLVGDRANSWSNIDSAVSAAPSISTPTEDIQTKPTVSISNPDIDSLTGTPINSDTSPPASISPQSEILSNPPLLKPGQGEASALNDTSQEDPPIRQKRNTSTSSAEKNDTIFDNLKAQSFDTGVFVADETGQLEIDYLYDGNRHKGELAIFNLDGFDELNIKNYEQFASEAARRALTNSELGHVIFSDKTEGALLDSRYNSGKYQGIQTFNLNPGDEYGIMLVPNATIKDALNGRNIGGSKRPLFSLGSNDFEKDFRGQQFASLTENGQIFAIESSPINNSRSDRDYEDIILSIKGATASTPAIDEVINPKKKWPTKALGQQMEEYVKLPDITFNSGKFVVEDSGELKIDYLYDGNRHRGELAIFNLDGFDELNIRSYDEFASEAARRALTNSTLGYEILSDKTEGALLDSRYNSGEYQGIKTFNLNPGDEYGIMLVPNGTIEDALNRRNIGGTKRPLFSLGSDELDNFSGQQFASFRENGQILAIESSPINRSKSDRDYEDIILHIQGAKPDLQPLDEVINPQKDWSKSKWGIELIDSVSDSEDLGSAPGDLRLLTDLLYNPGETLQVLGEVSDSDGGGDIARIDFWWQKDGGEWEDVADVTEFIVDGDEARFDYELAGLEAGKYQLRAIAYDTKNNPTEEVTQSFKVLSLTPEEKEVSSPVKWPIEQGTNLNSYDPEALAQTREWVVSVKAGESSADLASKVEAEDLGAMGHIPNTYIWEFPANMTPEDVAKQLNSLPGVEFAYPQMPIELQSTSGPADEPLVKEGSQWHLRSGVNPDADANVTNVWEKGITGEGVVIGIVDEGFEIDDPEKNLVGHPDLVANYRSDLSYDFGEDDEFPSRLIHGVVESQESAKSILDGDETVSLLNVPLSGFIKDLQLEFDIQHDDVNNLEVTLISPSGTQELLTNVVNGINVIDLTTQFEMERRQGAWELQVKDTADDDNKRGILGGWSLEFETVNIHGTGSAGIAIAAGDNNFGGSGVAPGAEWAGLRINAGPQPLTGDVLAKALAWENQEIDIYSNGFGPGFFDLLPGAEFNLEEMTDKGRDGKGNIYVFAAGNGAAVGGNVNYNSFANARQTIAVAAIDNEGKHPVYSESGAPLLVSAYSDNGLDWEDEDFVGITTTAPYTDDGDDSNDYTSRFTGTSASTPFVAGGIALMLEANPNLTVRDVQHILVETANQNDSEDGDWVKNGGEYWVNHKYGFGAINVEDAVEEAKDWKPVNQEVEVSGFEWKGTGFIPEYDEDKPEDEQEFLTSKIAFDEEDDISVEWAEVVFNGEHRYLGELEIVLVSPDGTESVLMEPHTHNKYERDRFNSLAHWNFTSARHWGESSTGDWELRVRDTKDRAATRSRDNRVGQRNLWTSWELKLYGTKPNTAPEVTNLDGELNYTEDTRIAFPEIKVSDADGDDILVTLQLNNPAGGSIASSEGESDAEGALSFEGEVAEVNDLLADMEFIPAKNFSEDLEVTVEVTDNRIVVPLTGTIQLLGDADNDGPTVAQPIGEHTATEDELFEFVVPAQTFADVDDDGFNYSATVIDGSELPDWLSFEPATGTFSGTPENDYVGEVGVKLTATDDAGAAASDEFVVTVENVNDAPTLANPIGNRSLNAEELFSFSIPEETFADVDADDSLIYKVKLADGSRRPEWLLFDSDSRTLQATPPESAVGSLELKVEAIDKAGAKASDVFALTVEAASNLNNPPEVVNQIADQIATAGERFRWTISEDTFVDVDEGDALSYRVSKEDGSPLPDWLAFNSGNLTFQGIPESDDVGNLTVKVEATDKEDANVSDIFALTVEAAPNLNNPPEVVNEIAD